MRVLQLGEPILRTACTPVAAVEVRSAEIKGLLDQMIAVLRGVKAISARNGNGLAAPQVGVARRAAVVFFEEEYHALINPTIVERSAEMCTTREGCLSCFCLRAEIPRHVSITVRYLDRGGDSQVRGFSGDLAALVQHEIDHLDGVLFLDRVEDASDLKSIHAVHGAGPQRLETIGQIIEYVTG